MISNAPSSITVSYTHLVVYPEKQLAAWTAIRYSSDHIFDYIELDEEHAIFEVSVPATWIEKKV